MSKLPVLIVGAGPTGLVLAIELARRGVPFHLIDHRPEPLSWDRAAFVKSRSLEIFATLGLADAFVRHGHLINGFDFYAGGAETVSYRLNSLDSPFPFFLGISESKTERLLTEKLELLGGHVEHGIEFLDFLEEPAALRVRLRTAKGERWVTVSWLVAADGLHSAVRNAAGIAFTGHDYKLRWGVVDARLSGWQYPKDTVAVQFVPLLYAAPIGGGRRRIYFRADPSTDVGIAYVEEQLEALAPGAKLAEPDEPQLFHSHRRIAEHFRAGRVLLAGDAAHVISPIQAHGMNIGIQDSFNLGWKLALVVDGSAPEGLLDTYESERRPVAELLGATGDEVEAIATAGDPKATDTVRRALGTESDRDNMATDESEIGFRYDASPIVAAIGPQPSSPPSTEVGCRVGDAGPVEGHNGTIRLHEIFLHTGHTLLVLLGKAGAAAIDDGLTLARQVTQRYDHHVKAYVVTINKIIPESGAPELLLDKNEAVHARLGGDQPCLCLVRPDGHLGLRLTPISITALEHQLGRTFL